MTFALNRYIAKLIKRLLLEEKANVAFAIKDFLATVCHPERSRSLRVVNEQTKVRSTAGIS